jgi:hypothetical protein
MTTSDQQQSPTPNVRTLRLHALCVLIGAPITPAFFIAVWLFLGAESLKEPSNLGIDFARFIIAACVFSTVIGAPIYFVAGLIQLFTGRRIGIVESYFQKKGSQQQTTTSRKNPVTEDIAPKPKPKSDVMACPQCGSKYQAADYQEDAQTWLCSSCKNPLPKSHNKKRE